MLEDVKSGDIIATGQANTIGHVGIIVSVFDTPLVYEFTMDDREPCVRTARENPKGAQVHRIPDVIDGAKRSWLVSLNRPLYPFEEDRLLETVEGYLGHGPDYLRDGRDVVSGPFCDFRRWLSPTRYLAAEMVQLALNLVGLYPANEVGGLTPNALISRLTRKGIYRPPVLIT